MRIGATVADKHVLPTRQRPLTYSPLLLYSAVSSLAGSPLSAMSSESAASGVYDGEPAKRPRPNHLPSDDDDGGGGGSMLLDAGSGAATASTHHQKEARDLAAPVRARVAAAAAAADTDSASAAAAAAAAILARKRASHFAARFAVCGLCGRMVRARVLGRHGMACRNIHAARRRRSERGSPAEPPSPAAPSAPKKKKKMIHSGCLQVENSNTQ